MQRSTPTKKPSSAIANIYVLAVLTVFALPLLLRANTVVYRSAHKIDMLKVAAQTMAHDWLVICPVLALMLLSYSGLLSALLARLLRIVACAVLGVYLLDAVAMLGFASRLTIADVTRYFSYAMDYANDIAAALTPMSVVALVVVVVIGLLVVFVHTTAGRKTVATAAAGLVVASLAFAVIHVETGFDNMWKIKNVAEYNYEMLGEGRDYSKAFASQLTHSEPRTCAAVEQRKPNVIVVLAESWSAYHSQYFSGLNNWTPKLDEIAAKGRAYLNFYSNGFITESAEIATLTGLQPLEPPAVEKTHGQNGFRGFSGVPSSLAKLLNQHGYFTGFYTAVTLDFSQTGEWLESLKFTEIEGTLAPFYDDWERWGYFNAAPDEALMRRMLHKLDTDAPPSPYFMYMKTYSMHTPFYHPITKEQSLEATSRYADEQFKLFYDGLEQRNFFDDGILVIYGDHRVLAPTTPEEVAKYGVARAASVVPMVIIGDGIEPGQVTELYQQTDLANGIRSMVTGQSCTTEWLGDVLAGTPPKRVMHRRNDQRNWVSVFSETDEYTVVLNGDDTQLLEDDVPPAVANEIISKVNMVRLGRQ